MADEGSPGLQPPPVPPAQPAVPPAPPAQLSIPPAQPAQYHNWIGHILKQNL